VESLAEAGFDIAHAFDAHATATEPQLAWLGEGERRGILIGNTRALWPCFMAALREDPELARAPHPLERYTERVVATAFPEARTYYAHRRYQLEATPVATERGGAGSFLPFQRLAVAAGLAALAPTQLLIHPSYGPWFALRAVVLVAGEPVARRPIASPCQCDDACPRAFAAALDGGDWRAWLAVRDACTLRTWRYDDDQIHYHYTKTWR
jgi:hypothetical protein